MYRTNFGIGHSLQEILMPIHPSRWVRAGHKGLFDTLNNSLHFQLGWRWRALERSPRWWHNICIPSSLRLPGTRFYDTGFSLHASPIHRRLHPVRSLAHGAIFFIRDYDPEQNKGNVLARILDHKEAIISHLSG
jgi:photosystem I P700 chlorophyll a apoprotein A2